jgi:hypothetical protein
MLCHDSSLLRRLYAKITWPVSVRTLMDPTNFLSNDHWNVRYQLGLSSHSRCQRRTSNRQYEDLVILLALRRPLPYPPILTPLCRCCGANPFAHSQRLVACASSQHRWC